mmetsp:Transcript_12193/g.18200  ORF Transcript_12193/g.18200 Transcript_12193/m.18200 type:complete len:242 (-) Transcript_12193:111-836(-)
MPSTSVSNLSPDINGFKNGKIEASQTTTRPSTFFFFMIFIFIASAVGCIGIRIVCCHTSFESMSLAGGLWYASFDCLKEVSLLRFTTLIEIVREFFADIVSFSAELRHPIPSADVKFTNNSPDINTEHFGDKSAGFTVAMLLLSFSISGIRVRLIRYKHFFPLRPSRDCARRSRRSNCQYIFLSTLEGSCPPLPGDVLLLEFRFSPTTAILHRTLSFPLEYALSIRLDVLEQKGYHSVETL